MPWRRSHPRAGPLGAVAASAVHTRAAARVPASAGGYTADSRVRTRNAWARGRSSRRRAAGLIVAPRRQRGLGRCARVLSCSRKLGLLDGKRAATHWGRCASLAEQYPSVTVDADALYVVDGKVWTSAGITAGIDMALAMVSGDVGASIASQTAAGPRALCAPSRLSNAIQPPAAGPNQGRQPVRRTDRLAAGQSAASA